MRYLFTLIVFFGFKVQLAKAQAKTATLSLYYTINEARSDANISRLDSFYKLPGIASGTFSIYGYADFLSNDPYNRSLSQQRANQVKAYLIKKDPKLVIALCKGFGEGNSSDNLSPEGEPNERRVDVVVVTKRSVKKIGVRDNVVQEGKKEKPADLKNIGHLEKGESIAIEGLNFIPGKHRLVASAVPLLEELLETLTIHPTLKVEIQGHICCEGPEQQDGLDYDTGERKLSENRAKAVYDYLIKNGIDPNRLTYKGYGHTRPKIKIERTPEDEQINRRVEIKILEN